MPPDACPRDVPDEPGSLPQAGIHHVAIQVRRHRRGRMPEHPLNHLRIRASRQPHRRCRMTQLMNAEAGDTDSRYGRAPAH
jgi:hypothetical protein